MKIIEITKAALSAIVDFVTSKYKLRLLLIILLMCGAITDFIINGQSRRTFIFYDYVNENVIVEDRMFKRSSCRETALRRYIEEALLGPITQDFVPLFPRETQLKTLLYRDRIIYADFTKSAAIPLDEGRNPKENFITLKEGIFRNFSYVKDIRFFVEGQIIFEDIL